MYTQDLCAFCLQHCDKIIAQHYPEISDKANGTFINAIIINCDEVSLVKSDDVSWNIAMDRPMVSCIINIDLKR